MEMPVKYVRLSRANTNSWLTYKLPKSMEAYKVEAFMKSVLPGWEVEFSSPENPDEDLANA